MDQKRGADHLGPISSNAFSPKVRKNAQNAKSLSATFGKMNWESAFCASRMLLRDAFSAPRSGLRGARRGECVPVQFSDSGAIRASRMGLRGGVPGDSSGIPGLRDHRTPGSGVGVAGRALCLPKGFAGPGEPCACLSLTHRGRRLLTSGCCIFACLRTEGISNLRPPTSNLQNPQAVWNPLLPKTRPQLLWNPLLQNHWT